MKRFLYAAPTALLSTACAMRPWTPSVSVAYWAQEVPQSVETNIPTSEQLMPVWQLPSGNPWSRYNKMTLVASLDKLERVDDLPDIERLDVLDDARDAARIVARTGMPPNTLWMVDLRGAASVAFGTTLSQEAREPVSLVMTFNNWPAPYELVPASETLSALIRMAPKLPDPAASLTHPVFLLDAWRLAYRNDEPPGAAFDNRYMINPVDLPPPEYLRANGITRVLYVVEDLDDTETEEDDLYGVFAGYQHAGIALYLVDLRMVARPRSQARWANDLPSYSLFVRRRHTLLDDPHFYNRARAGFGAYGGRPFTGGGRLGGHNPWRNGGG